MPRLQLKRSLEAATGGDDAPCGRRLLCIWRMALEVSRGGGGWGLGLGVGVRGWKVEKMQNMTSRSNCRFDFR